MSLKKPSLTDIIEVLETLSEQGFIDVGPQERGYDLLPLYDFLVNSDIAIKINPLSPPTLPLRGYWLELNNPEACDMLIEILKSADIASYIEEAKKTVKEETT